MVVVYSKEITPRITYTLNLIFSEILGISHRLTTNINDFEKASGNKINYSDRALPQSCHIQPSGLLIESGLEKQEITLDKWGKLPIFYKSGKGDVPFDLFSAVFYLVSRYEEYLPFQPDIYGRFEADQSLSSKGDFLTIPVVDLWCIELAKILGEYENCENIKPENYNFLLTVDIDHAWVYKNRGLIHFLGGTIKDILTLNFNRLSHRINANSNKNADPGDTYELLHEVQKKLINPIRYFILCSRKARYDNAITTRNKSFRELILRLDRDKKLGIHPSYASNNSNHILVKEYGRLTNILKRKIEISRQHYLKVQLPGTYRNLIKLGILEDHTMGYGSRTGFRAGIARPFHFYDLLEEKQTPLRIVPFQVMDRTLLSYNNMTPNEAEQEFKYYTDTIKSVGGQFVSLWHNTSLSEYDEWKGWRKVFDKMIMMNL